MCCTGRISKNLEKIDGLIIDEEVVDAAAEAARVPQMPLGESRLTNLDHYFLGQDFSDFWIICVLN